MWVSLYLNQFFSTCWSLLQVKKIKIMLIDREVHESMMVLSLRAFFLYYSEEEKFEKKDSIIAFSLDIWKSFFLNFQDFILFNSNLIAFCSRTFFQVFSPILCAHSAILCVFMCFGGFRFFEKKTVSSLFDSIN